MIALRDERGLVYLEFLIVFVPIWTFSLCIFQLIQIAQADLIVRHAAQAAARSASVVLPDDPNEYGGEPERSIARNEVVMGSLPAQIARVSEEVVSPSGSSGRVVANLGRSRLNTIRLAAHVPLMPLAPMGLGGLTKTTLRRALGGNAALASALLHQPVALAISFPDAEGDFVTGPDVRVRVTYAFECMVPLARRILCSAFDAARNRSPELQHVFLPVAQGLMGGRFRRLQHDAQALIQDAPYEYRRRGS
jgi:hypothetical protein